jgi:hypothetical protein
MMCNVVSFETSEDTTLLYLDIKYLQMISSQLDGFTQKSEHLWNCRCPVCGDSTKNKRKQRGFFYRADDHLVYKCHNCALSISFASFLKQYGNETLYGEYRMEKFLDNKPTTPPPFTKSPAPKPNKTIRSVATSLEILPDDHPAVMYCLGRGVDPSQLHKLFFLPHTKDIVEIAPRYEGRLVGDEPRVVFPLYDPTNTFAGVGMRAIENTPDIKRYINIKIDKDNLGHLFFGLPHINRNETVYVVEGAFDSLFIPNSIACNTSGLLTALTLDLPDVVFVWDNEPRNREICKIQERAIEAGHKVCVWPERLEQKDLNDMAQAGVDVLAIVQENTYRDIEASFHFSGWKKC